MHIALLQLYFYVPSNVMVFYVVDNNTLYFGWTVDGTRLYHVFNDSEDAFSSTSILWHASG